MNEPLMLDSDGGNAATRADLGELRAMNSHDLRGHSLWKLVSERLGGRWKLAVPLAVVLSIGFGAIGYVSATTNYQSTGLVRVVPNITPIMRQTAETGLLPLYTNYVQTQATLITSQRVLERAVQSLDMSKVPWPDRAAGLGAVQDVTARAQPNSELILVTFRHESPDVAQIVVSSVIRAFNDLYGSVDNDEITRKLQSLRTYRETLRNQQRQQRSQLQESISNGEYGVDDFTVLINEKVASIQRVEQELRQLNDQLASLQLPSKESSSGAAEPTPATDASVLRRLEAYDVELARLRTMRDAAYSEAEGFRNKFPATYPPRQASEQNLRIFDQQYNDRVKAVWQELHDAGQWAVIDPKKDLQQKIQRVEDQLNADRAATRRLTEMQLALSVQRNELADLDQELTETSARIRSLEIESEAIRTGRIIIASTGDRPTSPAQDRRKHMAVLGVVAGLGIGFGLFLVLGTVDKRAFFTNQLSTSMTASRVLGVLPALPRQHRNVEAAGVAAHCVHQIRNKIESSRVAGTSIVLGISSPDPGDGKTSLSMALGASFAKSGSRTLLVDCDLCGQGLTRHMSLQGVSGFRETIATKHVNGCIVHVPVENLSVLPAGADTHIGPEMIRKDDMSALLSSLRSNFDVVIIDTGPILGSIESLPVAAAVDGVVLTIRRGSRQSRLEDCIRLIHSVGASYIGSVLNFAHSSDCNRYTSKSQVSGELARREDSETDSLNSDGSRTEAMARRNALWHAMSANESERPDKQ